MSDVNNNFLNTALDIVSGQKTKVLKYHRSERTKLFFWLGKLISEQEPVNSTDPEIHFNLVSTLANFLASKYDTSFNSSLLESAYKLYKRARSLTGQISFRLSFEHYQYLIELPDEEIIYYERQALRDDLNLEDLKKLVSTEQQKD
ncbi:MAG: hypothetical protein WCK98_05645 [bacterium]